MNKSTFIKCSDAREFIENDLKDCSVSLFLIDPPYMSIVKDHWDNQWKDVQSYVDWMYSILEVLKPKMKPNGSVIFFGGIGKHGHRPFQKLMEKIEDNNLYWYRNQVVWSKKRAYGKMLSLDTELPTPNGFIRLRDLKEGDELFDELGKICKVTKLHEINETPVSFKVTFDDGTVVDACADHLWSTFSKKERMNGSNPTIRTTKEIMETLKYGTKQETNHSIPCCKPVEYSTKELAIDPYLLGLWLGDGTSQSGCITTADPEILKEFEHSLIPCSLGKSKASLYRIKGLTTQLKMLGLLNNKHIPENYMYSDTQQRLALLQGLMDTDGSCAKNGQTEFSTSSEQLSKQVLELMLSLGLKTRIIKRSSWFNGRQYKDNYRIWCMTSEPVFRLPRKLERLTVQVKKTQKTRNKHRYIVNVEPINPIPMRCITVDSFNNLFLITRNFIPTHNSHDYLFTREEIAWYSVSPERTEVIFNIPLLDVKRGYSGFNKKYAAKSQYKRVTNVWSDITELFKTERATQKPIALMERLIETHSNMGDLVVDVFSGWGTTGVAALRKQRRFLGCERIESDAIKANERCIKEIMNSVTKENLEKVVWVGEDGAPVTFKDLMTTDPIHANTFFLKEHPEENKDQPCYCQTCLSYE